MTALTAVVSWGATELASHVREMFAKRKPLTYALETNPSRIGSFSDTAIEGVIPASVKTRGSPGSGCKGFHAWLRTNRGLDAPATKLQLTLQGRASDPVLITAIRAVVVKRSPPLHGIGVVCPTAGVQQFRAVKVDLDAVPPKVTYELPGGRGVGFTLNKGETETFDVLASTHQGSYRWVLVLDLVVDSKKRTVKVDDHGHPFATTAADGRAAWSWNYADGWTSSGRRGVDRRPEIPAGIPLPVSPGQ